MSHKCWQQLQKTPRSSPQWQGQADQKDLHNLEEQTETDEAMQTELHL